MSTQDGGEIFNAYQTWIASGACPKQFFIVGTNQLDKRYEGLLDNFVETKCGGLYNSTNLSLASVFLLLDSEWKAKFAQQEHQSKVELAKREWFRRVAEVQRWVNEHPNCKQDDEAIGVIKEFFANNPYATLADWDDYTQTIPNEARLWKQPKPLDLVAIVKSIRARDRQDYENQLTRLRTLYGDSPVQKALDELKAAMERGREVQTWRETPQDVGARHQREAAEAKQRKEAQDKKAEEKAQWLAEKLASGFAGQTHSESFQCREKLAKIVVYKQHSDAIDWLATLASRETWIANYQGKNPSVVIRNA